ncbi:enteropeptidase [Cheilinus undulatus]|uniref:enteropeptidase n=1 Tax=Cheilinus undulatus TaxID=241271 RepID=UPI001BD5E46B|nr:enteropeptidase [Cheilinus undulatus]
MRRRLSGLETLLSILTSLLLLCCVALIVVSWLSLQREGSDETAVLRGQMVITDGAVFSEDLRNSSSVLYKSLAYDVQRLVSDAFGLSELSDDFTSCHVLYFSRGSVAVTFDLWFNQLIDPKEAEQKLGAGLLELGTTGLVIDRNSIKITEKSNESTETPPTVTPSPDVSTETPPTVTPSPATCSPDQTSCSDQSACVFIYRLCDGVRDCPDASDEDSALCATRCDGQFLLKGLSGEISSSETKERRFCRWIIRVEEGLSVRINMLQFDSEENIDVLRLYEGVGAQKHLTAELSGSAYPGTVWLLTNQSTVEFTSDDVNSLASFKATYNTVNTSNLSDQVKLTCTFEEGVCLWRQQIDEEEDDGDWIRVRGATFPPLSGPSVDHTLGNSSGFYLVTPPTPGNWPRSFRIESLPLTPPTPPSCLSFWYHMYGEDVHRLSVLMFRPSGVISVFRKDGNYGDSWHYGQVTVIVTEETRVVFEALKRGGIRNDIALDDITLTIGQCGPSPPDPTNVLPPTTPPPIPADCGGPFDLWEPNSTFSSPNYPQSYGQEAECLWTLHAPEGLNIQLHFLDFDIEATYDVLEVRDGAGPNSTLLAVLTGSSGPAHDLFSTTNQMAVWFFTDESGYRRGFKANFTSGVNLGSPAPCADGQFQCLTGSCIHRNGYCDGVVDCPDGSDESECVVFQMNSSAPLRFKRASSLLTVCADTWNSHLSVFTCQYLGYRWGEESLLPVLPGYSPFTNISISNGTLQTTASDSCSSDRVVSLTCNNQPCGVRQISNYSTRMDQSAESSPGSGEVRVVGGVDAIKGAWPWMVSLWWKGRHVCGASVIGGEWLLTAAHCVYGKNVHLESWTAVFGLHAQSNSSSVDVQTRRVDRIIINTEYNRQTKQADIAMMHLQQPINFTDSIQPVCLPPEGHDLSAGRRCFIAGWGREEEGGSIPDVLQEAQVPLLDQDQCQLMLPEYTITPSMLCAGFPEGGVDSCQGDSGGPLMCEEDGFWTLIGVTSFGVGCGRPQRPGVYAKVSAFTSWIAQTRRSVPELFSTF